MSDTRYFRRLQVDLERIVRGSQDRRVYSDNHVELPPGVPFEAQIGIGTQRAGGEAGGGIASPVTELDFANRTFHALIEIASTDGFIIMEVNPINNVTMQDANLETVNFIYADPSA